MRAQSAHEHSSTVTLHLPTHQGSEPPNVQRDLRALGQSPCRPRTPGLVGRANPRAEKLPPAAIGCHLVPRRYAFQAGPGTADVIATPPGYSKSTFALYIKGVPVKRNTSALNPAQLATYL